MRVELIEDILTAVLYPLAILQGLQCGTATSAACNLVSTYRSRNITKTSCLLLGALARFPAGKTHSIVISLEYIRELTFRKTVPDPYSFQ